MKWHYIQHVEFEGPAYLEAWAESRGHLLEGTCLWDTEEFPSLETFDGLFILGGPMNVYEEDLYPWLVSERRFISEVISAGKPVLGICLGAQLLSVGLGGSVAGNFSREIGWFPVELTPEARKDTLIGRFPERFLAFHWHGDRFTIPPGAIHLASSQACPEQAFVYAGRVVGLQFHLEATKESISALLRHCGDQVTSAPYIQPPSQISPSAELLARTHRLLDTLLDALAADACR